MHLKRLLLIEDDLLSRINFCERFKNLFEIDIAHSKEEAKIKLKKNQYDLAFIDLDLDHELDGLKIIKYAKEKNVHSVILTARNNDEIIREAYFLGVDDYLLKPIRKEALDSIQKKVKFKNEKNNMLLKLQNIFSFEEEKILEISHHIETVLCNNSAIHIIGKTGTGKTTLAKIIHEAIGAELPFVHLNCAELSENLLESELFGHVKGAFTGAIAEKQGLIELADNGILFLDEIGSMSIATQKKLLKVLEEKEFKKVGGVKNIKSNFRLISATCDDLKVMMNSKQFREDFYYRISDHVIKLPSLTQSKNYLSNVIRKKLNESDRKIFLSKEAEDLLLGYSWPGNLRQLDKVVSQLININKGIIELIDVEKLIDIKDSQNNNAHIAEEKLVEEIGLANYLSKIEKNIVEKYLDKNDQKVRKTLKDLKISNNTFYRIINNQ